MGGGRLHSGGLLAARRTFLGCALVLRSLKRVCMAMCRFLTRLHYCAADPSHAGKPQQWGEHEVDHILFIRAEVDVAANPEEVAAHRWGSAVNHIWVGCNCADKWTRKPSFQAQEVCVCLAAL